MAINIKSATPGGLERTLTDLKRKLGDKTHVNVGFLEGATYPDGTPVAYIAAIQEFGGKAEIPEREQTIYRSINADGSFRKRGRFVKKKSSNFATDHTVAAHEIVIPPRPFMRNTITNNQPDWGRMLGASLKASGYNAATAIGIVGEGMVKQMQKEIIDMKSPPNAPSTVREKGFNNPLIDTAHMLHSVASEVKSGNND
ncbi:hypothetical protein [Acetobacter thailandicus]|uniref:hypothetical protein n=1 Tax=Acetobacter thailandicus TaxID=1502842 RepID=UPI001BAC3826|nr:hypothetical protein [Acetobacter thailandicus]MBS0959784.1 hypothetical protein [Acetobacter thailandicus]